jgi:plastocyanin
MSRRIGIMGLLTATLLCAFAVNFATAAEVTGQVAVSAVNGKARPNRDVSVVFWLAPYPDDAASRTRAQSDAAHLQLIQRNKVFDPHVLAVQAGSQVDFPNRDPFFHNVFSLFNGKRFDLGLYEAGSTRNVHFDRAGICYIFCNIHPQMSAVVVVVDTPYFAVSDARGDVVISGVPPGQYQLNLWEEHCSAKTLKGLSRVVTVGQDAMRLGSIHLQESNEPVAMHLNKYGKPYDPQVFSSPVYVQP